MIESLKERQINPLKKSRKGAERCAVVDITDYSSRGPTSQFTAVLASVQGDSAPSHRYKARIITIHIKKRRGILGEKKTNSGVN